MLRFNLDGGIRSLLAIFLLISASVASAQTYLPVGPQTSVSESTVTSGGWTLCYSDLYNTTGFSWAQVQAQCGGARLMLACRPTGSATLQLLAQAPRSDVLTDTGTDSATTHEANGVAWYWNDNYSWGFATPGDSVDKNECDVDGSGANNTRLCWHTLQDGSGDNLVGGYRCGADQGLNGSTSFERLIYVATPVSAVPALTPWGMGLLLSAMGGLAVWRRRKR